MKADRKPGNGPEVGGSTNGTGPLPNSFLWSDGSDTLEVSLSCMGITAVGTYRWNPLGGHWDWEGWKR